MIKRLFLIAAASGLIITVFTGLVNSTPHDILGAAWYGWPLAWLYVIVYPGSPWRIGWLNLAGDLVLWVAVSLATVLLGVQITKSKK